MEYEITLSVVWGSSSQAVMWHQLQKSNQEISFNSLIKLKMFPAHDRALWPKSSKTLRHMFNFKHTRCSTEVNRTIYIHKVKYKLKCISGPGPKGSVPCRVQARRLWLDGLTEFGREGHDVICLVLPAYASFQATNFLSFLFIANLSISLVLLSCCCSHFQMKVLIFFFKPF